MITLISSNQRVLENISQPLSTLPYPLQLYSSISDWNICNSKHTPIILILDEDLRSDIYTEHSISRLKGIQFECLVIVTSEISTTTRIEYLKSGFLDLIPQDIHPLELIFKIKNLIALCQKNNEIKEYPVNEEDRVLYFLKQNVNIYLTVELLAEQLHMSRSTLQRICFRCFHLNPKQLITQYKIRFSLQLIDSGMRNVTSLSNRVGFNNVNTFITSFKRIIGTTPKEYIKRRHAENQSIPTDMPLFVA